MMNQPKPYITKEYGLFNPGLKDSFRSRQFPRNLKSNPNHTLIKDELCKRFIQSDDWLLWPYNFLVIQIFKEHLEPKLFLHDHFLPILVPFSLFLFCHRGKDQGYNKNQEQNNAFSHGSSIYWFLVRPKIINNKYAIRVLCINCIILCIIGFAIFLPFVILFLFFDFDTLKKCGFFP